MHPKIVFLEDYIEIPRYFFWVRRISIDSILSLEEIKIKEKEFGVIVGLRNGAIIHYEQDTFKKSEDYLRFKDVINNILNRNLELFHVNTIKIESLN